MTQHCDGHVTLPRPEWGTASQSQGGKGRIKNQVEMHCSNTCPGVFWPKYAHYVHDDRIYHRHIALNNSWKPQLQETSYTSLAELGNTFAK